MAHGAFAQRDLAFVNQQVEAFTKELALQGIDTWIWTMRYCDGRTEMFRMPDGTNCFSKGTYYEVYLFYTHSEGKMRMKKFDNCGTFYPFDFSDDTLLVQLNDNWSSLEGEEVKAYQEVVRSENPELRTAIHNCRRKLSMTKDGQQLDKMYNLFDLVEDTNLNYKMNKNLNLIKLEDQMDQLIDQTTSNLNRVKQ
ncbi:hypothetical protein BST85_06035 [Aureitalea marina]|uniref:Uncharacterized protein n=2 Tax=Aureitalea marina TaxID=930804 RepID=A0A2S7KPK1_9FLAO|nr:hypothetical protein BST85_06035 [Aureitalea marina]